MYMTPWHFPMTINSFDFDGVVYFGKENLGVRPSPRDVIITGRSFEEKEKTISWCNRFDIHNEIFFSKVPFALKTREISGYHKALTLRKLMQHQKIEMHFEDDPIQKTIIEAMVPEIKVVHLVHELTEK